VPIGKTEDAGQGSAEMVKRLEGRNAVVTGAGRGIGRAVAHALAEEGANIVVCDCGVAVDGTGTDTTPADIVASECRKLGAGAVAHYGDVADFYVADDIVRSCTDTFGSIDILCNIAGISVPRMIFNMSEEEWDRVVTVHLKGTFNLTRHASSLMRKQRWGRIINCSSEACLGGVALANYAAAKGGILSLTYAIAQEMERYAVTCNAFIPRSWTRMADEAVAERAKIGRLNPDWVDEMRKELADPSHIAPLVVYLASDAAADVNGRAFLISGNTFAVWTKPRTVGQVHRDSRKRGIWSVEELANLVPEKLQFDSETNMPLGAEWQ